MAIGTHHSAKAKSTTYLTPIELIRSLGRFNLDPCTPPSMPWKTAKKRFTEADDGLSEEWFGRVWLNPPYGREADDWLHRLAYHGNGIALTFARTETASWFRNVWPKADALLFLQGRLHFYNEAG